MKRGGLTQTAIAELAAVSRSQVNRWTRAEHQPSYEPVRRLADKLGERGPEMRALGRNLLETAGYASPEPEPPAQHPVDAGVVRSYGIDPDGPQPDEPPGGFRNGDERVIWALVGLHWSSRLAAILTIRENEARLHPPRKHGENPDWQERRHA